MDTRPSHNADRAGPVSASPALVRSPEWFGPGEPLPPAAQQIIGRQFDYGSGVNLRQTPKNNEGTTYSQLRALADNYDLLRLVIETRKDQIAKLEWNVQPKKDLPKEIRQDPILKRRAKEVEGLLMFPDREHDWNTWLRLILEDMLVIDAATVYVRPNGLGEVFSLDVIDGSTIKRVVDDTGRTPPPPTPAYQQIIKGMPAVDYTTDEMIFFPRNPRPHRFYGLSPTEQVIMTVNIAIRRQISQLQFYTEGNVPEALIGVPETWTPAQIKQFQEYWDALLEGNTAQRRHAKFIPGNMPIQFTRGENNLMDQYDEWLARIICYCFSLPPLPFVKQFNRATAQTHYQMALEEGLVPMMQWVKALIDRVISRHMKLDDIEFSWVDKKDVDPQAAASIDTNYIRMGVKSIDEVRQGLGLDPLGMGHALFGVGPAGVVFISDLVDPAVRQNMFDQLAKPPPDPMEQMMLQSELEAQNAERMAAQPGNGPPEKAPPKAVEGKKAPPAKAPPKQKVEAQPDRVQVIQQALAELENLMHKRGDNADKIGEALQKGDDIPPELEDLLAENGYRIVEDDGSDEGGSGQSSRATQGSRPRKA